MESISQDAAKKFCELCNWAYESWINHTMLFDDNLDTVCTIDKSAHFFCRLQCITQEYCLQQIAKLHDPSVQGGSLNLSIDYIVRYGDWSDRHDEIRTIQDKLQILWSHLKPARNKLLAHNDMESLMEDKPLGSFPEGADKEYFETLQTLVNIVHEKWIGVPYPFYDLAKTDVKEFLALLKNA